MDRDDTIWLCLKNATSDADKRVAELAEKALDDLSHLSFERDNMAEMGTGYPEEQTDFFFGVRPDGRPI